MAGRKVLSTLFQLQLRVGIAQAVRMHRNVVHCSVLPRHLPLCHTIRGFQTSVTLQNDHIISIQDEEDFKARVLKNTTPVLIDFFATWCGPCKQLAPRLESLIANKNGKVILAKIDIDQMTDLAVNHGVEAVPTVIAMKNGEVIDKFVGLKDEAQLESFVDKLIN